jgi:hypothetical protein
MTLCIAAVVRDTDEDHVVFCADMKVGTWAASAEIGFKFKWAGLNSPAMIYGEMSNAAELVETFGMHLNGMALDSHNVFDAMKAAGHVFREKLADGIVRRKLSVSYEYLKKNKGKFPAATVLETYTEIGQIDSGTEMIVSGFIKSRAYLFVVERDCTVTSRENFAAIGTGAYVAEPALFQRRQNISYPLGKTMYHTYEAKRLGEIAEGVGEYTCMLIFSPPKDIEIRSRMINEEGKSFLEEKYKEFGLKSTWEFKWPEASTRNADEIIEAAAKQGRVNLETPQ